MGSATRNSSERNKKRIGKPGRTPAKTPPAGTGRAFDEIMGQFDKARSVLNTVSRALDHSSDERVTTDQAVTLHCALGLLREVYNRLDLAILRLPR
jgi:hypothetical protein